LIALCCAQVATGGVPSRGKKMVKEDTSKEALENSKIQNQLEAKKSASQDQGE